VNRWIPNYDRLGRSLPSIFVDKHAVTEESLLKVHDAPYSALVKKEGNVVYAVDVNGKTIAEGKAGVDDADVIQAAIDYASNNGGGRVFIKRGTYEITSQITLYDNIIIAGEGKNTVLQIKEGIRPNHVNSILFAQDKQHITITHIYFDGNLRTNGTTDGKFEGAINLYGGSYISIENCVFYDFYSNPINAIPSGTTNPEFFYIANNTILSHNGDAAIRIRGGYRCIVVNNKIYGGTGIWLDEGTYHSIVANNIIRPNHGGTNIDEGAYNDLGISLYSSDRNIIAGNVISDAKIGSDTYGGTGIALKSSNTNLVVSNIIRDCEGPGITISDSSENVIAFNLLSNNCKNSSAAYRYEIYVFAASTRVLNAILSNKIIETGGQTSSGGIYIDSYQDKTIIKNNIIENITPAIDDNGANTIIKNNYGYLTENSGKATFSGDGTTTQFKIAHGLVSKPSKVLVTPASADAAGDFYVTADDTYIYVNYLSAPPSGTDNVVLCWYAEV